MFTIKTLNAISPVGLAKLNKNLFDVSAVSYTHLTLPTNARV